MNRRYACLAGLTAGLSLLLTAGCPLNLPGVTDVTVRVFNDTDFPVDPHIRYAADTSVVDVDSGTLELATGTLDPGETKTFHFTCNDLGLVFSRNAEQFLLLGVTAEAGNSALLTRNTDYSCGAVLMFRFTGEGNDFAVVSSVNGHVVN